MLDKEFIPYEQALELKELGFDEPCLGYYHNKELSFGPRISYGEVIEVPTFSQAFRWFREKYNIDGEPYLIPLMHNGEYLKQKPSDKEYSFKLTIDGIPQYVTNEHIYSSYEEAELECLKKLIEIVKN